MTHSVEFDEIRKLRKGDDPLLAQGEWVCEIRSPQWTRVRELCEGLFSQTKDLQVACWHTESITYTDGFHGLRIGFHTLSGLLACFWSTGSATLFPVDQDERIARLEWLNTQLPLVINSIPMTSQGTGAYSRMKWEESRAVENLGLRDIKARDAAIEEGKLAGEVWDKAATASGRPFYTAMIEHLKQLQEAFAKMEALVEQRFAPDSPDLGGIREALEGCHDLATLTLRRFETSSPREEESLSITPLNEEDWASTAPTLNLEATPPPPIHLPTGAISSRGEAIRQLREIAKYFRTNEPHSPVALLAERAARWGEMSLEHWLGHVIKDENTLGQLQDLLDLHREQ